MLRHVVCLTWRETASPAAVDAVRRALADLPGIIPEIRAYTVASDLGLAAGNADLAIVADFDDADGWRTYLEHPAHQAVLRERIQPILAHRAAVQCELPQSS
jgi:hypothetical protein